MLTGNYDRTYDARVECSRAEDDELRREVSKGKQVGHERNIVDPATKVKFSQLHSNMFMHAQI